MQKNNFGNTIKGGGMLHVDMTPSSIKMLGKRKRNLETTIFAAQEEKKPKDCQSDTVYSGGAIPTNSMTTPTSIIQNSPQPLLDTTNSPQGAAQPKRIKVTPLQPEQPIPPVPQTSTPTLLVTPDTGNKSSISDSEDQISESDSEDQILESDTEGKSDCFKCVEKNNKIQTLQFTEFQLRAQVASTQRLYTSTGKDLKESTKNYKKFRQDWASSK